MQFLVGQAIEIVIREALELIIGKAVEVVGAEPIDAVGGVDALHLVERTIRRSVERTDFAQSGDAGLFQERRGHRERRGPSRHERRNLLHEGQGPLREAS